MNLETTRLRGRPRNRWQDEVREDERAGGGKGRVTGNITERNGKSSWEQQGILAFCTCQWNEWTNCKEKRTACLYIYPVIGVKCVIVINSYFQLWVILQSHAWSVVYFSSRIYLHCICAFSLYLFTQSCHFLVRCSKTVARCSHLNLLFVFCSHFT